MRLAGKIAIVTGAGSGFGEGIATTFAREGARIIVNDLNTEAGERVASAIRVAGGDAHFVHADVSDGEAVASLLAATLERYSDLDIVVNNAGTTHRNKPVLEITEHEFDRVFAVNVKSLYWTARHMVPHFRARAAAACSSTWRRRRASGRGRAGLVQREQGAVITASKAMAAELGPDRIRVNCVNPVMGATGLLEQFMGMPDTPENRARFLASIPMGRLSTPQDVANACLYLASDEAEFITGACLEG